MTHPLMHLQTTLTLTSGRKITGWCPNTQDDLQEIPATTKPVLVLAGDDPTCDRDVSKYAHVIRDIVVPICQAQQVAIIGSGLDLGLSRIAGQALQSYRESHPYGEEAPLFGVTWQWQPQNHLEPNYTQFVLAPGHTIDDVRPYALALAGKISRGKRSATVLFEGREAAWREVLSSVCADRPVIVINGTGGTADLLATAYRGTQVKDAPLYLNGILDSEQIYVIDLATVSNELPKLLSQLLLISPHLA